MPSDPALSGHAIPPVSESERKGRVGAMPGGLEQTLTTSEVKKRTVATVSTMPEGLFDALPVETLQQLVAYLQTNASPAKPNTAAAALAPASSPCAAASS